MNLEEIKAWLLANKDNTDVKTYLEELSTPTVEGVEGFLDTAEGKKVLQPRLDSNFTKGLNTWKEKNLNALVEDEVKKRNPDKSPDLLALEALQKRFDDSEKAIKREKLMNKAILEANDKGLPVSILDFFVSDDEETTSANLAKFEEAYNTSLSASVEARIKGTGRKYTKGSGEPESVGSTFAEKANVLPPVVENNLWK